MITFSETITLLTLIFFLSLDHVIVMIMIVMPWIMIIINLQTFNYFLSLDHITIMIIIMTIWLMITVTLQTFNYFLSLDMPVMELLGSSETGGPQTACLKVKTYSHKHLFIESTINNWKKNSSIISSITFTFTDLQGPGMRQGSVGKSYPHFETTILNPDQKYWPLRTLT